MALTELGLQGLGVALLAYAAWQFASHQQDRRNRRNAVKSSVDDTMDTL